MLFRNKLIIFTFIRLGSWAVPPFYEQPDGLLVEENLPVPVLLGGVVILLCGGVPLPFACPPRIVQPISDLSETAVLTVPDEIQCHLHLVQ